MKKSMLIICLVVAIFLSGCTGQQIKPTINGHPVQTNKDNDNTGWVILAIAVGVVAGILIYQSQQEDRVAVIHTGY